MSRIAEYLSPEMQSQYVEALRRAYDATGSRHDESLGDNALTFGTLASNTAKFLIEQGLGEYVQRGDVQVSRPANSFQVTTDVCTLHYYKYADNVHNIKFDQSATKAQIAEANQLLLPLYDEFAAKNENIKSANGVAPFLHLVVAHTGDPEGGLSEVWVGAPKSVGGGGESPWSWVDCIYKRSPGDSPGIEGIPEPEGPSPFSTAPSPAVEIRRRTDQKTA